MEFFHKLYDLLRHLGDDDKWVAMIDFVGLYKLYFVLCAIVFCETGLVVLPFLPGDSLLFAIGAVTVRAQKIDMSLPLISVLLICAALLGDNVNYWVGRTIGPKLFRREEEGFAEVAPTGANTVDYARPKPKRSLASRLLNRKHLERSHAFYEKYGKKTIILARFVPIVRTFAPFVAGIARMSYPTFLLFSVIGAVLWVNLCVWAGYLLGGLDFFKKHFELVILLIVVISLIPMVVEYVKARAEKKHAIAETK
jgi:membrane-associated protein